MKVLMISCVLCTQDYCSEKAPGARAQFRETERYYNNNNNNNDNVAKKNLNYIRHRRIEQRNPLNSLFLTQSFSHPTTYS